MVYRASLILALVCLLACSRRSNSVIVVDGWWNADYAKQSCRMANAWVKQPGTARLIAQYGCATVAACPEMMPRVNACSWDDPTPEVREFENQLATAFATDAMCHDMTLVKLIDPKDADPQVAKALAGPHWFLQLNFNPGSAEQNWTLLSPNRRNHIGTGDATNIAHRICW
jgi:hypothetical protein